MWSGPWEKHCGGSVDVLLLVHRYIADKYRTGLGSSQWAVNLRDWE